jgi:MFS family permease
MERVEQYGAGGQQEPYLVNGANSLTFGIMVFGCSIFGVLANKIGIKKVLIIGTLGYAPYSASLYVNNRYGVEWFVLFGGATCGIAASALWASERAIALGYGDIKDRGKFSKPQKVLPFRLPCGINPGTFD